MAVHETNKETIGILGCGWLGTALGERLHEMGKIVHGTTRNKTNFDLLKTKQIIPFEVDCLEEDCLGLDLFLSTLDRLVIALPPGLRENPKRRFDLVLKTIIKKIELTNIKHIVFISSTSVYGNTQGKITESTPPQPLSRSGKQLLKCEQMLLAKKEFNVQILRFGGLIGSSRHPIFSLAKQPYVKNPDGKINYIHQKDAVEMIVLCLHNNSAPGVFNGVAPSHPFRYLYFLEMSKIAQVNCPPGGEEKASIREISAEKFCHTFDFKFTVNNLLTFK